MKDHPPKVNRPKRDPVDPAARAWFMIFVLLVCVGMMIFIDFNRRLWNAPAPKPIAGRDWGNPDAELKIIQFLDFESPEIVRGAEIISQFMRKHPQTVFLQTRYFPQEDKSILITRYEECANQQKKFRTFTTLLFERYYQWASLPGLAPILNTIASDAGLDKDQLKGCLASEQTTAVIAVDRIYGESMAVRSSPTYFLNGKMAVGVEALEKALKAWDEPLSQEE
jgi:hypothetical protein